MTFKFLNFCVHNLAKPDKKTLKTSLHHQHLIKHIKRTASSPGALIAFSCAKYCCVYDAGCRARSEDEREAWFVFRPRATSRVVHATVFRARKSNQSAWGRGCQKEENRCISCFVTVLFTLR